MEKLPVIVATSLKWLQNFILYYSFFNYFLFHIIWLLVFSFDNDYLIFLLYLNHFPIAKFLSLFSVLLG